MEYTNLWRRSREEQYDKGGVWILENSFKSCFSQLQCNTYVDTYVKDAALTVSPSLVSLISYSGEEAIFWASGTIIESEIVGDTYFSYALTSASLLRQGCAHSFAEELKVEVILPNGNRCGADIVACDWHFNICALKFESNAPLPVARLRCLDTSETIDTRGHREISFQLCPRSNLFQLSPGTDVIALGRYHQQPYDLMVAPGKLSIDRCGFDCQELLRVTCKITKCGIGGPMVNLYGEVVGINFYDEHYTPFLPMNVICKWWELTKGCRLEEYARPWLGLQVSALLAVEVDELEIIMQKFPDILKGILVEEVTPGSPAAAAGIRPNDVITHLGGKDIGSPLELFCITWDKVGEGVTAVGRRASTGEHLNLPMVVGSIGGASQFYSWPLPNERWKSIPLM